MIDSQISCSHVYTKIPGTLTQTCPMYDFTVSRSEMLNLFQTSDGINASAKTDVTSFREKGQQHYQSFQCKSYYFFQHLQPLKQHMGKKRYILNPFEHYSCLLLCQRCNVFTWFTTDSTLILVLAYFTVLTFTLILIYLLNLSVERGHQGTNNPMFVK